MTLERQNDMQNRGALFLLLLLAASLLLFAQDLPERELKREKLEADLRYLASDELQGRFATEPGARVAADYIEQRFRQAGARPLPALGSYRQSVPLLSLPPSPSEGSLKLLQEEFLAGESLLILQGEPLEGEYLLAAAETMAELPQDLEGRVVLVAFGDPERPDSPRAAIRAGAGKAQMAQERGAVALVEIYTGQAFENFVRFLGRPRVRAGAPKEETQPRQMLLAAESELWSRIKSEDGLKAAVRTPGRSAQAASSDNVVAWIEGSDPALREQFVALSAHYDHVGANPNLPGASPDDFIFNGARDNAMGVTAVMAAAEALAARPPKRSVIFIAFTAEEVGLLGSRYMAENPPFELKRLVFLLNSDSGGYTDTDVATVVGMERVTARPLIERACREFGLEAIPNPAPEQGLFNRSDNIHFARKGIPSPTFSPGFRAWTQELVKHYHRPSDEVGEDFDFDYLLRFSQAFSNTIRTLADAPEQPAWVEGQPFIEAWKELYGKSDEAADDSANAEGSGS